MHSGNKYVNKLWRLRTIIWVSYGLCHENLIELAKLLTWRNLATLLSEGKPALTTGPQQLLVYYMGCVFARSVMTSTRSGACVLHRL